MKKRIQIVLPAVLLVAAAGAAFARDVASPLVLFTAISGRPGPSEAAEIVARSRRAGFSQWMIYPRSGLELEYMGEEWLAFVGAFLKEAKACGGHVWLYDEYNWPSGSCKGRVPMENGEWTYSECAVRKNADGSFSWERKFNDKLSMYDLYFDVNAYHEEAIRRFIALTHRVYEARFTPYFKDGTIKGIFTDEPAHPSAMHWDGTKPVVTFRWWPELEEQYRARTGRAFRADVEEALRDARKVAVWELYTELKGLQFRRAFFDQIARWCRKMGIELCGHMIAEGNPLDACSYNGLPLNTVCGLTLPGMDKIGAYLGRRSEWLTYATAQYGIERRSAPGARLSCHGGIELFALGPMDLTVPQLAQRIWTSALYGMDTYFSSLYHLTARGFLEKGGYGMFMSPTQPYFDMLADLHAEAARAAAWSRKRFVREVAVRYPQRLFGRLALGQRAPQEKNPPLVPLVQGFAWGQISFELIQEDEASDLPYVFSFKDGGIVEERRARAFADAAEVLEWLYAVTDGSWRVTEADGRVAEGLLVRRYADGTGVVLDLATRARTGLRLGARPAFDLPAGGRAFFGTNEPNGRQGRVRGAVRAASWALALRKPNLKRIWFASNHVARVVVREPIRDARWLVCNYPTNAVRVFVDGAPVAARRPAEDAPYAYAPVYGASDPFTLESGVHELRLEGRADNSVFLPVLWLAGTFAAPEGGLSAPPASTARLASLADLGLGDYAGTVAYTAEVRVDGPRLKLETGGLVARVRVDGRDLGTQSVGPFAWDMPQDCIGRTVRLTVEVTTSIRPAFGPEKADGVVLAQRLWCPTVWNEASGGLLSAVWQDVAD